MSFERAPRPASGPASPRRRGGALAPTLAILGVIVVLSLLLSSVWTNVLWYRSVDFTQVYVTELVTKAVLFVVGAVVMAAAVFASLTVAYRSRPVYAPVSTEQASLDRYRDSIEPLRKVVVAGVPIALGLFAGSAASQQWQTVLLWWNRVPFGTRDEQFNMDVGFFVFTLPWLQFLTGFVTAVVFLSGLAAIITHYLYGGIRLQGTGSRFTDAARIHLATLAAVFLLLRAVDYWLGRYALTTKDSPIITGLRFTDANAVLVARGVLAGIALIVAVLFVAAAVVDRFRMLPLYGVVLLVVSAILVGGIYPAVVQRFQVRPNERAKEAEFIEKNIKATKAAYGLDKVEKKQYVASTEATPDKLREDASLIPGIRLIDPYLVSDAFRQLEQNRQYYAFPDSLDVDRYEIDGQRADTVVAVRELDLDDAPQSQRNWVNDHLVYTHGFGIVAAYGNRRDQNGRPQFFQSGFPTTFDGEEYQPRVYFGERSPEYSIVGAPQTTRAQEFDSPGSGVDQRDQNYTYTGKGGVPVGSFVNRLLYAIKFREQNILLSGGINSESRILYDRRPRERVQKVAPFLTLDGDPYPSVVDGKLVWIVDAYTTTDRYPYSRTQLLSEATEDALTAAQTTGVPQLGAKRVNYMRNSVKATVDAYDGTVTLYAWDDQDPILKAWRKVFPGSVLPISRIGGDLMSHLRYPEDLFKVQRQLLGRYHVDDPETFFSGSKQWRVPNDPTGEATTANEFQPPYYLTLQMPDQPQESFSLTSTYVPAQGQAGQQRNNLTAFLAVDADAGTESGVRKDGYGTLRLLELPDALNVSGPPQVQNAFKADPEIGEQLNPLKVGGSTIQYGNLLTLPLGGGFLYVQPVYVRGAGTNTYPLLQKVLVSFGDNIAFADDLKPALDTLFGGTGSTGNGAGNGAGNGGTQNPTSPSTPSSPSTGGSSGPSGSAQADLTKALQDAQAALEESRAALAKGDFTAYGAAQQKLTDAVNRAIDAQKRLGQTTSSATRAPSSTASASVTG